MTENHYDVIVVGLGAMGSAALYQSAKRGANVLGIDRFTPPHNNGSSHGDTRITRQAIGEGEMYMPFIHRTNAIWHELEAETRRDLYLKTGGLIIAPQTGSAEWHLKDDFVNVTAKIAKGHNIEHEVIDADEVCRRHANLILRPQDYAYYEPDAGVLRPELCISAQLELAQKHGATTHTNETVVDYEAHGDGVTVTTDKATYQADKMIVSAGAWVLDLLDEQFRPDVKVYRQVIYWFEAEEIEAYTEENFPFLIWIGDNAEDFFSVFPTPRDGIQGVKVLTEQYAKTTHPNDVDRTVKSEEIAHLYEMTQARLNGVTDQLVHADVCMYTSTPDEHFIIDTHPESDRIVIASPCSGHGFKHSAAIGETLAELTLQGKTTLDISGFKLSRLMT